MLSEEDLRQQMHSSLEPLLARVQPRDMVLAIRRRQQRRTQVFAGVAAAVGVLAITMPLVLSGLDDRGPNGPSGTPSPVATAAATKGVLVTTGECAGLAVAVTRPGQPAGRALPLEPAPAVNETMMSNSDMRYVEATGPCADRLRVHTYGELLAGSVPAVDDYVGDMGAPLIAKYHSDSGSQLVELFLDCPGVEGMRPCAGVPQPLAVVLIEVFPAPEHSMASSVQGSMS